MFPLREIGSRPHLCEEPYAFARDFYNISLRSPRAILAKAQVEELVGAAVSGSAIDPIA